MLIDMLARFPTVGPWLRDAGLPLLSLVGLLAVGAMALRKSEQLPLPALPDQKPLAPTLV